MNEPKDENSFIPDFSSGIIKNSRVFEEIIESYLHSHKDDNGNPKYAFSTVYRCLQTFEDAGILSRLSAVTSDNAMYELRLVQHRHYAICLKCKERFPLRTCFLGDLKNMLPADMEGFQITGHQLEIYGYCPKCQ